MNEEKPMFLSFAQSKTVVQTAADCEMKAIFPGLAATGENVQLKLCQGRMIPKLFGPKTRMFNDEISKGLGSSEITIANGVPLSSSSLSNCSLRETFVHKIAISGV
ncbi:Uncharacterised protein [Vibrio alginolyticus]|nr:Uncharacterised protein [Vibrio alginolyticus]